MLNIILLLQAPSKKNVRYKVTTISQTEHKVEYCPAELGVYTIHIQYGKDPIGGSPFKAFVYDLSKVRIIKDKRLESGDWDGILGEDRMEFLGECD